MRILIAEDEAVSRRILESRLTRWGYEVISAANGQEAWTNLAGSDPPRIAILDWIMPEMDGVEVCRNVRARGDEPYIYLLLLTTKTQIADLVTAMDAGADDYLTKPFDPHELEVRLRAGRRIIELQEALISAREAMRTQATRDGLTGLWNRRAILETLEREISRVKREGKPLGVMLVDLDHFKLVNDTHGHLAGDEVLRETAKRMLAAVRPYDAIGRYGGEEFLIVMPGCDEAGLSSAAERLRSCIGDRAMESPEGRVSVTVSVGVAALKDPQNAEAGALLRAADAALYEAKARGRNRVEMA